LVLRKRSKSHKSYTRGIFIDMVILQLNPIIPVSSFELSSVELAEAIKHMFDRQIDMVKEQSGRVSKQVLQVLATSRSLTNKQDQLAVNWLCKNGFALWMKTSSWAQSGEVTRTQTKELCLSPEWTKLHT
jgi:hypothetical protein